MIRHYTFGPVTLQLRFSEHHERYEYQAWWEAVGRRSFEAWFGMRRGQDAAVEGLWSAPECEED